MLLLALITGVHILSAYYMLFLPFDSMCSDLIPSLHGVVCQSITGFHVLSAYCMRFLTLSRAGQMCLTALLLYMICIAWRTLLTRLPITACTAQLQPHLEQLRALKHQAQAQKHELGIESSWVCLPSLLSSSHYGLAHCPKRKEKEGWTCGVPHSSTNVPCTNVSSQTEGGSVDTPDDQSLAGDEPS